MDFSIVSDELGNQNGVRQSARKDLYQLDENRTFFLRCEVYFSNDSLINCSRGNCGSPQFLTHEPTLNYKNGDDITITGSYINKTNPSLIKVAYMAPIGQVTDEMNLTEYDCQKRFKHYYDPNASNQNLFKKTLKILVSRPLMEPKMIASKPVLKCLNETFQNISNRIIDFNMNSELLCPFENANSLSSINYKLISPQNISLFENNLGSFNVTPLSSNDLGLYKCIAENFAGSIVCNLNVSSFPSECKIEYELGFPKSTTFLNCKYENYHDDIEMKWFLFKKTINDGDILIQAEVEKFTRVIIDLKNEATSELFIMFKSKYGNSAMRKVIDTASTDILSGFGRLTLEARNFCIIAAGLLFVILALFAFTYCCCQKCSKNGENYE